MGNRHLEGVLEGKICLITGARRGIGRATAERFAMEGAVVYANIREEKNDLEWIDNINYKVNGKIVPIYFDLTKADEIKSAILCLKKEPRIDVLVNNAGMVTNERLGMISREIMRSMFEVNVFGLLDLTQYIVSRFMIRQKSGSIINIASMVGSEGCKGQVAYSASKGAVIAMTKSMSKELVTHNIRVNAVAPGMIETARLKNTIEEKYKGEVPFIGMGRLGTPEEIADACMYFASDYSKYTTGQILAVGGGIVL